MHRACSLCRLRHHKEFLAERPQCRVQTGGRRVVARIEPPPDHFFIDAEAMGHGEPWQPEPFRLEK